MERKEKDGQSPPAGRTCAAEGAMSEHGAGAEDSALLRRLRDRTFRTLDGKALIAIDAVCGRRIVPIQSRPCRQWVGFKLEEESGERPSQAELRSAIDRLEVYALDAPVDDVHVRVALADGRVFIDLADNRGRAVEIGPDGWKVIDTAPVHFVRPASLRALPEPEKGGSIEDLRSLINVADDGDFVLIVAWLLDALRNDGAHPVLVINGGEGAAKSTLVEILQALIDPSWARLDGLPNTERQFKAAEGYLRPYDNVSSISAKISDALCRLSTGRPAYPIILNGIDNLVMRPELADRCLFVNAAPVSDRQRRSLREIRATFEKMRPRILGALLDAVAHGLRALPTTRLDGLPRMADFALWATACEGALWPNGTFMAAYLENRTEAAEKLIETDVVATAPDSQAGDLVGNGDRAGYQAADGRRRRHQGLARTAPISGSPAPCAGIIAGQNRHRRSLRQSRPRPEARDRPVEDWGAPRSARGERHRCVHPCGRCGRCRCGEVYPRGRCGRCRRCGRRGTQR
jgi:hypothetical protein